MAKKVKKDNKVLKTEKVKSNKSKEKSKKLFSNKVTAVLYFLCGGCWIISALLYKAANENCTFDIVLGIIFIALGIFYLYKSKKENK